MADEKTVKVDLRRTYAKGPNKYGPGDGVEMPEGLARALGLHPDQQKAAPKAKAAPKGRAK